MNRTTDGAADVPRATQFQGPAMRNFEIERDVVRHLAWHSEAYYWTMCFVCICLTLKIPLGELVPWRSPLLTTLFCLIFVTRHSDPPSQFIFDNTAGRFLGLRADLTTGAYPSDGWRHGVSFFRRVAFILVTAVFWSKIGWWHPYGAYGPPRDVFFREFPKVLATAVVGTVSLFTIDHLFFQSPAVTGIRNRRPRRA
ncbi:hypothetical protein BKA65DRAFT_477814 [Rhexocercosporidium sp. MPI-PUGE-AT-0058]|nr:hypothetical protein BKA65DRAFT_477814 [Rhexocercosporidium sp. MPI-PUGE-AT-0058]